MIDDGHDRNTFLLSHTLHTSSIRLLIQLTSSLVGVVQIAVAILGLFLAQRFIFVVFPMTTEHQLLPCGSCERRQLYKPHSPEHRRVLNVLRQGLLQERFRAAGIIHNQVHGRHQS
jgi:hypothetical protein